MNRSNYYISLDIRDSYGACLLDMKQADTHRRLHITLTDGGVPYMLTPGCYPVFTAKRPDGSGIFNACTVEDNTVIYDITLQDTAVAGLLRCELRLYDGALELDQNGIPEICDENIQLLTCATFGIRIHPTVYDDSDTPASGEALTALTHTIADARSTVQAILDAKNSGQFNGPQGEQGPQGEPGAKGEKGDTGAPGADGYTPVRGVDFWTEEDQQQFDAAIAQKAQIRNDTVGADAWSSKAIIDRLCPGFTESGRVTQCQPVESYPLEVVCQITPSLEGITQLTVTQLGKNLLTNLYSESGRNRYIYATNGKLYEFTSSPVGDPLKCYATDFIPCSHLQGFTLTWNGLPKNLLNKDTNAGIAFYREASQATGSYISGTSKQSTFTVPDDAKYMRLTLFVVALPDQQLELGSAITAFEPYTEKTYSADFGGAIYGGSFDWTTGTLTETYNLLKMYNLDWVYHEDNQCFYARIDGATTGEAFCNIFSHMWGEYDEIITGGIMSDNVFDIHPQENKIAVNCFDYDNVSDFVSHLREKDAVLVYPLAAPVTTPFEPQTITANAGVNTLYSDAGSTRVSGKSDPVTVIETLSTRLAALEDAAI